MADLDTYVLILTQNLILLKEKGNAFRNFLRLEVEHYDSLVKLLDQIILQVPEGKIQKQRLFSEVYGTSKSYQSSKMQELLLIYKKLLKDFLTLHQLRKTKGLRHKLLTASLRDARMTEAYMSFAHDLMNIANPDTEAEYHLLLSQQLEESYDYDSELNARNTQVINESIYHHDLYFLIKRLKFSIERLIHDKQENKSSNDIKIVIQQISVLLEEKDVPIIHLLKETVQYYLKPSEKGYYSLKNTFHNRIDYIQTERKTLFFFVVNALVFAHLASEITPREYFEWYKFGDEKGILAEKGVLGCDTFDNITYTCYILRETCWLERFLQNYSSLIIGNGKTINRVLLQSNCYLLFGQKKYGAVLELLERLEIHNFQQFIHRETLRFKSIYEFDKKNAHSKYKEVSNRFTASMSRYRNTKKVNPKHYDQCMNFFKMLKKIASHQWFKNTSKNELTRRLESFNNNIAEYTWLKEKISEFLK